MTATTFVSPLGEIEITKATATDLAAAMAILDEAATRLCARGIHQWSSPPPPGLWRLIEREIDAGYLYLVKVDNSARTIGLFRLRGEDGYWPATARATPGAAGYVYSLALCNDACGYGIGQQILQWIGDSLREQQCRYLRIDCMAANARLRQYYEAQGFVYCGQVVDGDYTLALYQLTL
ncbi:MAG: GNAT family N-acetyltransferase [Caldilineaceae bacterium]